MGSSAEENALQNDLILKTILGYCSIKTLWNARLVSSKWYALSLSRWRAETKCVAIDELLLAGDDDFLQLSRYPTDSFCCDGGGRTVEENRFWLPTLINMRQTVIRHLEIRNYKFRSKSEIKHIIFCKLPNLETFKLDKIIVETENVGEEMLGDFDVVVREKLHTLYLGLENGFGAGFQLGLFLRSMPGLKNLFVHSYERDQSFNFFGNFLRWINEFRRRNPTMFRLETLDWIMSKEWALKDIPFEIMDFVDTYGEESLDLKTLSIDIGSYTRENLDDSFREIIERVAGTIQNLDVYCKGHSLGGFNPQSFFATKLDNLKSLRITNIVFCDMSFLKYMPKLETLHVTNNANNTKIYMTGIIDDTDLVSTQMDGFISKSLKVLCFGYLCGMNEIDSLIQWMPCLKEVFLVIGEQAVLDKISENFKMMSKLTILPLCQLNINCDKFKGVNVRIVNNLRQFNLNCTKRSNFNQLIKKTE